MDKIEALELIKNTWRDESIDLGKKIISISTAFYSSGLSLDTTAAYIKATPSELEALLSMGALDDSIIEKISEVNPPKTVWTLLSSASEEEVLEALDALKDNAGSMEDDSVELSQFVFQKMIEVAEPRTEQKLAVLTSSELKYAREKGENFGALSEWDVKFMKSITSQKHRGKVLSEKQLGILVGILNQLVDKGAISRQSIDNDQEFCDKVLDALGR